MEKFLIIDGNSLFNRAFYALPLLTNDMGQYSNAVYGFATMLIKAIQEHKPTHIVVALDYSRKTFRNEIYKEYKGTRKETPSELKCQLPILKKMLSAMEITAIEKKGIEADDILGTLCKSTDVETIILSGDKDLFQLIDDSTSIWFTHKGISDVETVNVTNFEEKTGYKPNQVIEFKALKGDSSDNIPGVRGIGDKTAVDLVQRYGNLENLYANIDEIKGTLHQKLIEDKEIAFMSRQLATIKTDCDINFNMADYKYKFPFGDEVYKLFQEYEFKSLLKRKDIFEENVEVKKTIEFQTMEIKSVDKLREVLAYVKDSNIMAFNFIGGIRFAFSSNFLYEVKQEYTLFENLTDEQIFAELKPILQNENIKKITFDLKSNMHTFGDEILGDVFDISIAKYLLGENQDYNEFCTEYFDKKDELSKKMNLLGVEKIYSDIELPLTYVLYDMENNGIKINKEKLDVYGQKLIQEKKEIEEYVYGFTGRDFNLNSSKQLAKLLFGTLHLSAYNNKKLSTNVEVLETLKDEHPIISYILRYRKLQKLISSYVDVFTNLVNKNGEIIKTKYNQTLTATGRLSSSDPNLQNVPARSEEAKSIREMFESRFENGYILSADYNQIELRLLANFSGDENLIKAFSLNEDVHTATAMYIFNGPACSVNEDLRRIAKAVNFGVIYGISDFGLSQNTGISRNDAKIYIDNYFAKYPKVKLYMKNNVDNAIKNGYCSTYFGRIRRIPELFSTSAAQRNFGSRAAMNMPLQGSASDILKMAMLRVNKQLKERNMKSKMILSIHDEIVLDVPNDELEMAKEILKNSMENVVDFKVKLLVKMASGKTWAEC